MRAPAAGSGERFTAVERVPAREGTRSQSLFQILGKNRPAAAFSSAGRLTPLGRRHTARTKDDCHGKSVPAPQPPRRVRETARFVASLTGGACASILGA